MMRPAYTVGAMDACARLGMHKEAQGSLLRQLAPAATTLAGGGLGAIGGAVAGGEGNRLEGALVGAGLGAMGAGVGKGLGQALSKSHVASAGRGVASAEKGLAGLPKVTDAGVLAGEGPAGAKTVAELLASKKTQTEGLEAAKAGLRSAEEGLAEGTLGRGGAMLGGVGGTAGAMSMMADEPAQPPPPPPGMNPYGY